MKVLLVGEGRHELSGALEAIVKRLSSIEIQCDADRVSRKHIHVHHGKGQVILKKR